MCLDLSNPSFAVFGPIKDFIICTCPSKIDLLVSKGSGFDFRFRHVTARTNGQPLQGETLGGGLGLFPPRGRTARNAKRLRVQLRLASLCAGSQAGLGRRVAPGPAPVRPRSRCSELVHGAHGEPMPLEADHGAADAAEAGGGLVQGNRDGNGVGSSLWRSSRCLCKLAQLPERHERCTRILCLAPSLAALRGLAGGFGTLCCATQSENLHDLLLGPRCRGKPVAAYFSAAVGRMPPVLSERCLSARRRRCPLGCTPIRASPKSPEATYSQRDSCNDLLGEEWQVSLVLLGAQWRGPLQDAALHLALTWLCLRAEHVERPASRPVNFGPRPRLDCHRGSIAAGGRFPNGACFDSRGNDSTM